MKIIKDTYLMFAVLLFAVASAQQVVSSSLHTVTVEPSAMLPDRVVTRATGDLMVDQVVCAVFVSSKEIASLREVLSVTSGTSMLALNSTTD